MVQTTLQALFQSTITGVVVRVLKISSVPVTDEGYLVESRRPLWFGSSQANRSVFITLSWHALPVGGSVTQHVNNQPPSW